MKKLLLFTVAFSCTIALTAQTDYSFSQRNENYTEMTGSTVVSSDDWDDFEKTIVLPFPLLYFGVAVDSISILDDGLQFTSDLDDFLSPHGSDPLSRGTGQSPVSYRVDGSGNTRILKIQWPNISFFSIIDSFPTDFVNYQVWFYEGSNIIEYHYGSSYISPDALDILQNDFFFAGISSLDGTKFIAVGGDPANPDISRDITSIPVFQANPSVNTVYVFTPGFPNGVLKSGDKLAGLSLYPIPVKQVLNIESNSSMSQIKVLNNSGQIVLQLNAEGTSHQIQTSELAPGVYFLQVETNDGVLTRKFVK